MTKYNILNQVKVLKEVQHIIKYQGFNNVILKISSGFLADLSVSSFQFSCSVVSDSETQWSAAPQASLSIINSRNLLKLMSIESVIPPSHLILSCPSPPALNLSQIQGLFQGVSSSPKKLKRQYYGLLRNLYAGQGATVRTGHGTTDWLQIRKEVGQSSILSPCLFNLHAESI